MISNTPSKEGTVHDTAYRVPSVLLYELDTKLVGGWFPNPSEKYARQIENLPQMGMKINNRYLKPPKLVTAHMLDP